VLGGRKCVAKPGGRHVVGGQVVGGLVGYEWPGGMSCVMEDVPAIGCRVVVVGVPMLS
jgi:hypothetical protein